MSCIDETDFDFEDFYKDKLNILNLDKNLEDKLINLENVILEAYNIFIRDWKHKYYDISKLRNKKFILNINKYSQKKVYIIYIYRKLISEGKIPKDDEFMLLLIKKPIRNSSGVNAFAILLPPFPDGQPFSCKHNCYYCPNETVSNGAEYDIPRSYISEEPAVARGLKNNWYAINQLNNRLDSLLIQGHTLGKLDLILEGGTYTEYPMSFLEKFHRDLFYCANTYFNKEPKREPYNLKDEMALNINKDIQIIGICIETRPDAISNEWIKFFRNVGVTRIQLGVQHNDNKLLKRVNRGHTFEDSCKAVDLLKNNCFKIDIHLMPDLPYATPEKDYYMFSNIFLTDKIQPDQVKIYPCQVTPYTEIKKWYDNRTYIPYFETDYEEFLNVIQYAMTIVPPWVRISRVVRDIPANFIKGGNTITNLRQLIENRIEDKGSYSMDIRNREINKHPEYQNEKPSLKIREYRSGSGTEYFISFESKDNKVIYGFTRLRIPDNKTHLPVFNCLFNRGLIRELHVYNTLVAVGNKSNNNSTQHKGLGKLLIKEAERISRENGMRGTVVITGEGVRGYYHKLGYYDCETFVVKDFLLKKKILYLLNELYLFAFVILFVLYILINIL